MRTLTAIALGAAALSAASSANAGLLEVKVFDDGVQVGATVTSGTGAIAYVGSDANFSDIQVSAQGDAIVPSPDLSSTTIEASTGPGFVGSHQLEVDVLQTGLAFLGGLMNVTGTVNGLIGAPGPTTENTELFPASGAAAAFGPNTVLVGAVTDDQQQYLTTFTTSQQSSSASMQFIGVAVPEPASSLALLGGSLLLLGLATQRGRRSQRRQA
jgi:hypothetical protein